MQVSLNLAQKLIQITRHLGHGPERPERPERPHGLEDGDVAGAEEGGRKVDDGDGHDDKVEEAPRVGEVADEALGEELQQGLQQEHYKSRGLQRLHPHLSNYFEP